MKSEDLKNVSKNQNKHDSCIIDKENNSSFSYKSLLILSMFASLTRKDNDEDISVKGEQNDGV